MNAAANPTGPPAKPKRRRGMDYAAGRHRRAARAFGFLVVAGDPAFWRNAVTVWQTRLTRTEAAYAATSLMLSLDPDARRAVFAAAMSEAE